MKKIPSQSDPFNGASTHPGRQRKPSAGFTMVELMIVVAIIGIIASLAPRVLVEIERFFLMNRTRATIQRDSRAALTLMTRNLRQAKVSTIVIDQAAGQPAYSRIAFYKADASVAVSTDNVKITYYQQGRDLKMAVRYASPVRVSTSTVCGNLRFLSFAVPDSTDLSIVAVSLTLEQTTFEGKLKGLHLASEKVRVMNP